MLPSPDGVSSALHDKVLDVSSPGVVQVRVPPFVDGSSPSSQDKFLDELVVVSHCPVSGFSSPSSQVGSPTTTNASAVGSGAGVSSGVGLGVSSGVGLGVSSGVGLGVSSGVGLGVSSGVGLGVSSGVGLGVSSGVGLGVSSGVGLGVSSGVKVVSSGGGIAKEVVLSGVVAIVGLDWIWRYRRCSCTIRLIVKLVEIRAA